MQHRTRSYLSSSWPCSRSGRDGSSSLPWRIFWQLTLICILGYGGINTFTNSAQQFLAACFYRGDQRAPGAVTRYINQFLLAFES
ncbi:hypothetical protein BDV29DRAFT_171976 [Aspergillus leporis]|uniref:Uncharacterized protein n=1 Tax=Aspergillus leporis TaxID=41062 RepID=A0A5N5X3Y5_9EURO|nr:hypothetical protein BDV29DRAFT_171976 [Aspergillus leporis]